MCRNITILRGIEPPATSQEVEDAARQYVRKVAGLTSAAHMERPDVTEAIARIARATNDLLKVLPARRSPPPGPPGRWRTYPSSPSPGQPVV